jgi:hypothetical protein
MQQGERPDERVRDYENAADSTFACFILRDILSQSYVWKQRGTSRSLLRYHAVTRWRREGA